MKYALLGNSDLNVSRICSIPDLHGMYGIR